MKGESSVLFRESRNDPNNRANRRIPRDSRGILVATIVACAIASSANAQGSLPFVVEGDGIRASLTGVPGDVTNGRKVALDRSVVSDSDLPRFKELMTVAAGIDLVRKDAIVVQTMPMDKQVQKLAQSTFANTATPKPPTTPLDIFGIARYLATLLIVAIVLFLAWRSVKKAQAAMGPARVPIDLVAIEAEQQQQANDMALAASGLGELPPGLSRPGSLKAIESSRSAVELEVVDLIERQPDEVAQTLRSWLADRRN